MQERTAASEIMKLYNGSPGSDEWKMQNNFFKPIYPFLEFRKPKFPPYKEAFKNRGLHYREEIIVLIDSFVINYNKGKSKKDKIPYKKHAWKKMGLKLKKYYVFYIINSFGEDFKKYMFKYYEGKPFDTNIFFNELKEIKKDDENQVQTNTNEDTPPANNIYEASIEGTPPANNIYEASMEGTPPANNIYEASMEGTPPTNNIYGASMEGTPPANNIYEASMEGTPPANNIYEVSMEGTPPTNNIYGASMEGTLPANNIYEVSMEGTPPTNNIYEASNETSLDRIIAEETPEDPPSEFGTLMIDSGDNLQELDFLIENSPENQGRFDPFSLDNYNNNNYTYDDDLIF